MVVHTYDEARCREVLERLNAPFRVAFALLCASRLLPAYKLFQDRTGRGRWALLDALREELWHHVLESQMSRQELQDAIDQCLAVVPTEEDGWDEDTQPYAEDAAAALAYAFRAALTGDPQEAVWASRRAYEAVDHYAGRSLDEPQDRPYDEDARIGHPAVQMELARQSRDLDDLELVADADRSRAIRVMRQRAHQEAWPPKAPHSKDR